MKTMKKVLATFLSVSIFLCGCTKNSDSDHEERVEKPAIQRDQTVLENTEIDNLDEDKKTIAFNQVGTESETYKLDDEEIIQFDGLEDESLLNYVEDNIYTSLIGELNSDKYLVEQVDAVYYSKEYLEEVAFNTKENIYFGYTMSELNNQFHGNRFMFTLGDDGKTVVKEYTYVSDETYENVVKNVAIGTGVILICVTVSTLTAGTAPAISMIFAASAKTGTAFALSSGGFGGISAAIVKGIETQNFSEALKAGTLAASEGVKWGAISGALIGGGGEAWGLYSATAKGLTMNQVAMIQQESGYPLSIIKQFHTIDEYKVFKNAGLEAEMIGEKLALVRNNIDLYGIKDEFGKNNFARLAEGLNPIDEFGNVFQWHHIGQENNATLALLTASEHNSGFLHGFKVISEIDRKAFSKYRREVLNKALLQWLVKSA